MTIEQIKVGWDNFSYVIFCPKTKKAAIVDPSFNTSKAKQFINSNNLKLEYIIITHYHSDHSADAWKLKKSYPSAQIVMSEIDGKLVRDEIDLFVKDSDQLKLGEIKLKIILTPGHTPGGICILVDNDAIITGDTLFISDCGRTDLLGGDLGQMFKSLHEKIYTLPDHLIVYPGHDYGPKPFDNLGNQKKTNKVFLAKTIEQFSKIP